MQWCDIDLGWAYGDLLGSIVRQTGSRERAYDVLHDALLRVVLARRAEPVRQPRAYLQTAVRSVLTDQGRDHARWLPYPHTDPDVGGDHPDVAAARHRLNEAADFAAAASPEFLTDLRLRLRALQRLVDALPPRCREVFWLFRVEGYTQPEIAQHLGITLKTVEHHMKRALTALLDASDEV